MSRRHRIELKYGGELPHGMYNALPWELEKLDLKVRPVGFWFSPKHEEPVLVAMTFEKKVLLKGTIYVVADFDLRKIVLRISYEAPVFLEDLVDAMALNLANRIREYYELKHHSYEVTME